MLKSKNSLLCGAVVLADCAKVKVRVKGKVKACVLVWAAPPLTPNKAQ